MPEWTALGWKSSTRVAPGGAPGSAPPPPQAARPAPTRAAASSAATRLMCPRRYRSGGSGNPVRLRAARQPWVSPLLRGGQSKVQDRGLAAYIAELVGTLLLVFFVTSVVALYIAT